MKIYANITQEVNIEPKEVIEELINKALGDSENWEFIEIDKCYIGYEQSAGAHFIDMKREISKEKYDYIQHLREVLNYLKSEK